MRMYDIIVKKRNGEVLNPDEISFFIDGYTNGKIPDYQASALLMAIYLNGMNEAETVALTRCMARSGDMVDLSAIDGIKADKHSTGGVGDKTTLVVAPIVAACGVKVAKMSGRGLGHTGGTIDKLESIQGFRTSIGRSEFFNIVNKAGLSVIGQSGNLAPADKKIYALRDVTGTVENISLIASSIMSKKLASGADCIMLDVKTGSGAFMKNTEDSIRLAEAMVKIGESAGRRTAALITNMDRPLGHAIGNSLEVIEAIETLEGHGPADLEEICIALASGMLNLSGLGSLEQCTVLAKKAVESGAAIEKLRLMVEMQGGDPAYIGDTSRFAAAAYKLEVRADRSGYIAHINTEKCGIASMLLGAGRETKDSAIDYSAGIVLNAKTGDFVNTGDTTAVLYTNNESAFRDAKTVLMDSMDLSEKKPEGQPLLYARVTKSGIQRL